VRWAKAQEGASRDAQSVCIYWRCCHGRQISRLSKSESVVDDSRWCYYPEAVAVTFLCVLYPVTPILNEGGVDLKISFKLQVDSIDRMHDYYNTRLVMCDHGCDI